MDKEPQDNQQPDLSTVEVSEQPLESPVVDNNTVDTSNNVTEPVIEVANTEGVATQVDGEPAMAVEPEKASEPTRDGDIIIPADKPKQSKGVLIAALVILVLACGGAGAWYFLSNNPSTPQNDQAQTEPTPDEKSELALTGNELSDFDLAFLKMESEAENVVYSPLSIKYALAMLSEAAGGDSKTQVTNILGDYQPKAYLNNSNRSLANAMFLRTNSPSAQLLKSSYTDTIGTKYNAEVVDDSFESPDAINEWVSDKTLGIIQNMFDEDSFNTDLDFVLLNTLAIDMDWNNQLQCSGVEREVPCMFYLVNYVHEKYSQFIDMVGEGDYSKVLFNGQTEVSAAEIGASTNRYDIINELGEDHIRTTVQTEYEKWLTEQGLQSSNFDMDEYIEELGKNYGQNKISTDFYFYDSDTEKVFAKDLKEYDGATLQYVGFMPKVDSLDTYIDNATAEKVGELVDDLKIASDVSNYKDGVVTKIRAYIPFFRFNYDMKNFKNNLAELGITDVFDETTADLSGMLNIDQAPANPYIKEAMHKADIDFSNDGIRAAAVTSLGGGLGGAADFDYEWDVPVEEIDLTFDKPFFFIIRDKDTGEVWFTGKVYNPAG